MKILLLLIQIGDLLEGKFNWRGFIQLVIFLLMGAVVVSFGAVIVFKALRSNKDK